MCAMESKQELEYWDINPDMIGDCCWNQYRPFLLPDRDHAPSPDPDGCRETMWKILELKDSGRISKVKKYFVTARKRSLGQGNIFASVCHSVHRGWGVCLSACWDTYPHPRREQTPPWEQTPPPSSRPPWGQTPSPGADTPLHSACWEIRSTSGWSASYWNAILLME